jgi:hypothetical protein
MTSVFGGPFFVLGFCLHAYGSFGGPEIVKDV